MSARSFWFTLLAASCVAAACGDTNDPADGGAPDGETPVPPGAPPVIPWLAAGEPPIALPDARPCPAGWGEHRSTSGLRLCDPTPTPAPVCAGNEALFVGGTACEPIGTPCPAGEFPDDLSTTGTVRYVSASAALGGDGTLARPFTRISDAAAVARAGDLIAVGKGRYDEVIVLPGGVTVRGACVAETVIVQTAVLPTTVLANPIVIPYDGVTIENLQVADAERSGISIRNMGSATISDVLVQNVRKAGIEVFEGESVTMRNVIVRDMRLRRESDDEGWGVASLDGDVHAERLVVERAIDAAIEVIDADGTFIDVAIRDVQPATRGDGRGIIAEGGLLSLTRVSIDGAPTTGIGVNPGVGVHLEDVVIERAAESGLSLAVGSRVEGAGLSIRNAGARGIIGQNTVVLLDDVSLVDTTRTDEPFAVVLFGATDERSVLRRVWVEGWNIGVVVGQSASARLEDVRITRPLHSVGDPGVPISHGLHVQEGGDVEVFRAVMEGFQTNAIAVRNELTNVLAEDVAVRDVTAAPPYAGAAAAVFELSSLTLRRALAERVQGFAVIADGPSAHITTSDLVLRDGTAFPGTTPLYGAGLWGQRGATIDFERVLIQSMAYGLAAHIGSDVRGSEIWVLDTHRSRCDGPCAYELGGHAVFTGGLLSMTNFRIADAEACGLLVFDEGVATLMDGTVERTEVGACIQSPAQTLDTLMRNVRYVDNGSNLDTTMLPTPEPYGGM